MGTRFCATKECSWPESYKTKMLQASEKDTVLLFRTLHNTARVFANEVAKKASSIEQAKGKDLSFEDIADLVSGKRGRQAEQDQDPDGGIWTGL